MVVNMSFQLKSVFISDDVDPRCVEVLKEYGIGVVIDTKLHLDKEKFLQEISKHDGLIVRSATKVTAAIIEAGKNLKIIGRAGTGVDNIDCDAATARGIIVMNTPGGNTLSAAEHTCALICCLSRDIPNAVATMRAGKWDRKNFMGSELYGKTLGIIGLGRIGKEVALRMQSFGMTTIGYDPIIPGTVSAEFGVEWMELEHLWPRVDYITVHTPLIPQTTNLINDAVFAKCKAGVRVVNCARGGIIDEDALLKALESGQCGGAGLDVYINEPPTDYKLAQHPKVIATPHLGASTVEAQKRVAVEIAEQFVDLMKGKSLFGADEVEDMKKNLDKLGQKCQGQENQMKKKDDLVAKLEDLLRSKEAEKEEWKKKHDDRLKKYNRAKCIVKDGAKMLNDHKCEIIELKAKISELENTIQSSREQINALQGAKSKDEEKIKENEAEMEINAQAMNNALSPDTRPWVELGRCLGTLLGKLGVNPKHGVSLLAYGQVLKNAGQYLSAAVLAGLLGNSTHCGCEGLNLNLVSAPALAKKLGIQVQVSMHDIATNFHGPLVLVTIDNQTVGGTAFGGQPLLESINGTQFSPLAALSGQVIVFKASADPGLLATIAGLIAGKGAHIQGLSVSGHKGGTQWGVVNLQTAPEVGLHGISAAVQSAFSISF